MILVGLQILHGTGKRERPSNENPSKPPHNGRIRMLVGGIIGIPVYFLLENTGLRFTAASTASLITGTVPVINALAYILYAFALKRLGSTVVTSFINLVPFFGVLSATILLGEPLSWVKAMSGILAITGVYLVSVGGDIQRAIGI